MDNAPPNGPSRHTENRHTEPGKICHHFFTYNLTCDEYDQLRARANGHCEICKTPERETTRGLLVIDHFQGGGVAFVRGLLCDKCNAVMARHDRAMVWGPATLPWAEQARAYHLNAWALPSAEEFRRAEQYIQSRRPFTVRGLPRSRKPARRKAKPP